MPPLPAKRAKPKRATTRRIENLLALTTELAARELDFLAASEFLQCSHSATRNYLYELRKAAVAVPCRPGKGGRFESQIFRLSEDPARVKAFVTLLTAGTHTRAASARDSRTLNPSETAQRDPLVAALFGARGNQPEDSELVNS